MIKLKTEVNKSAVMRELQAKAKKGFKNSWQPELQVQAYMNGVHDLFKLLRLGDVSNNEVFSEVAVCDCKAPAFRDEHGNHRCTECNELCNTD
jgi:hypothetical protein